MIIIIISPTCTVVGHAGVQLYIVHIVLNLLKKELRVEDVNCQANFFTYFKFEKYETEIIFSMMNSIKIWIFKKRGFLGFC